MSRRCSMLIAGLVAVAAGGARADEFSPEVKTVLEKCTKFDLYSLEPAQPGKRDAEDFHGWKVAGKMTVADDELRGKLLTAMFKAVTDYKEENNEKRCYKPRHGIRAEYDKKVVDLVICFSCGKIRAYSPDEFEENVYVTDEPTELFNATLKDAKVPLPSK